MDLTLLRNYLLNEANCSSIFPFSVNEKSVLSDSSKNNSDLKELDLSDVAAYSHYANSFRAKNNARVSVGGYLEERVIYKAQALFKNEQNRCIHLGVDVGTKAGIPIYSPLSGTVHSFNNNRGAGDYGPTLIIKHKINGASFHCLYGHLSLCSLNGLAVGKAINKGDWIGRIGNYPANGNWPPHLHFQLIVDMENKIGDYPGVCSAENLTHFKQNCPNPNWILQIDKLPL